MATYDVSQLNAIVPPHWEKKVEQQLFQRSPFAKRQQMKGIKLKGGQYIRVPVHIVAVSSSMYGWHDRTDTITLADATPVRAIDFPWTFIFGSMRIYQEDILQYGESIKDLVTINIEEIAGQTSTTLSQGYYSGNPQADPTQINGLQTMLDLDGGGDSEYPGTASGITNTTYWAASVADGVDDITLLKIGQRIDGCTFDMEKPTAMFTQYSQWRKVWSLVQPQQRYRDANMAKIGFDTLLLDANIPLFPDAQAQQMGGEDVIYILNEKYLHTWMHKDANPYKSPHIHVQTSFAWTQNILFMLAFGCNKRRAQGGIWGLSAT